MDNEKRTIRLIEKLIPRSGMSFESDAEVFSLNGMQMLFSMDEFSKEDNFRESDPFILGANLATGSISDILACGGTPLFYAHAMTIGRNWDDTFIMRFSKGVAQVLGNANITFLGGDLSKSENWHYTAAVIGNTDKRPIRRKGARAGDSVYVTGNIGAGNLEAAFSLYENKISGNKVLQKMISSISNRFYIRLKESRLIREYAGCCIDTSDGVFNAINEIAENNNTGYILENLPYIKRGTILAQMLSLPVVLLFLGECGEYELLFTIHPEDEKDFIKKAKKNSLRFINIGKITESHLRILKEQDRTLDLTHLDIRARDYDKCRDYINAIIQWLKERRVANGA